MLLELYFFIWFFCPCFHSHLAVSLMKLWSRLQTFHKMISKQEKNLAKTKITRLFKIKRPLKNIYFLISSNQVPEYILWASRAYYSSSLCPLEQTRHNAQSCSLAYYLTSLPHCSPDHWCSAPQVSAWTTPMALPPTFQIISNTMNSFTSGQGDKRKNLGPSLWRQVTKQFHNMYFI